MRRVRFVFAGLFVLVGCSSSHDSNPDSGSSAEVVACRVAYAGCMCSYIPSTGTPPAPTDCSPSTYPGTFCCAASGWPGSGSCTCTKSQTWTCALTVSTGYCRCGAGEVASASEVTTASCSDVSGSGFVCCKGGSLTGCVCKKAAACDAGETVAATCGGLVEECFGSEAAKTSSCSDGLSSGGGDSGTSSPGTGTCPAKAYVSCTSSSDCPCTGYCGHLASNETEKYCTIECQTDADCKSTPMFTVGSGGCNPITFTCSPG